MKEKVEIECPKFELTEEIKKKKYVISGDMYLLLNNIFNEYHEDKAQIYYLLGILQGYIQLQGIEEYK